MADRLVKLSEKEREEIVKSLPTSSKLRAKIERAGKKITVASAKGKGLNFQREMCAKISELIGIPYLRGSDDSLIESRGGGQHGVDIILRGEAKKKFPYSPECKNQEGMNLMETVNQSIANQQEGTDWIVFHRRKALPVDLVILSWEAFAKLWRGA